ncbi:hypothetical protein MEO41_27765, partial [Dolichospermum sp. ST_sed4]|nr:hypothetical protein [Dolichospermum sp. ST_sed4]
FKKTLGCPFCGGVSKKIGYAKSGKRRYLCLECKASFSRKKRPHFSLFLNFYRFVRGNHNKNGLSETMGLSRTTIWRKFSPFFSYFVSAAKINQIITKNCGDFSPKPWVLGLDGKWLRRLGIIIIYRDITDKINLFWSFHPSESYDSLKKDFETFSPLINDNLPRGVISDWKGSIRASVSAFLGDIPHQRCLSHVQREAFRL